MKKIVNSYITRVFREMQALKANTSAKPVNVTTVTLGAQNAPIPRRYRPPPFPLDINALQSYKETGVARRRKRRLRSFIDTP